MEKLFTESFFCKNGYFKNKLKISNDKLESIKKSISNWQKQCETFIKGIDKETTDSGPFIKVVFENILGYHDKGTSAENFTLISEFAIEGAGQGNSTGFSDLALGYFKKDQSKFSGDAQVLVEFKDQSSDDLEKPSQRKDKLSPVNQCWNYLNSYNKAKWGIVTNYNEIRLYNKNIGTTRYEVFYFVVPDELKDKKLPLSEENELLKLMAILHIDNLISISGISNSEDILNSQGIEENQIQNSFYKEYKILREKTFSNLLKINRGEYLYLHHISLGLFLISY